MMGNCMMVFWHADLRVGTVPLLAPNDHRDHARNVPLVRDDLEIHQHLSPIVQTWWRPQRAVRQRRKRLALLLRLLDAALVLADGIQVIADDGAVAWPHRSVKPINFLLQ